MLIALLPNLTGFYLSISQLLPSDSWAKSRVEEAPEAAERVLKLMIDKEGIEPDTLSYHGVLDAWANSGREDSLDKVRKIFLRMEDLHNEGKKVKATIRTVNAILNACAKSVSRYSSFAVKDYEKAATCADEAHVFFEEAKRKFEETEDPDWKLDITTYTSMMDVFARVGSYQASQKAEKLLEELKMAFEVTGDSRLRPNFRTYTALITSWSRTRSHESPGRVEQLLTEMKENPATTPNARAYTSAIQCWGRSRDPLKAKKALKILRLMQDEHKKTGNDDLRPTILSYNAAIDACARCQGRLEQQTEAIKIAFAVLKASEGDSTAKPNHNTYAYLLNAVAFLLPAGNERNQVASAVFEKARKGGLVQFDTVKNLRKSVDAQVMNKLMEGVVDKNGNFDYAQLPAAWSKNVK
jgi:hypothetical protein